MRMVTQRCSKLRTKLSKDQTDIKAEINSLSHLHSYPRNKTSKGHLHPKKEKKHEQMFTREKKN